MKVGSHGRNVVERLLERFVVWTTVLFVLAKAGMTQVATGFLVGAIGTTSEEAFGLSYTVATAPGKLVAEQPERFHELARANISVVVRPGLFGGDRSREWLALARSFGYDSLPLYVEIDDAGHVRSVRGLASQ